MRRKGIKNERKHIEYLTEKIQDEECATLFRHAIDWMQAQAESYRAWYYICQWLQAIFGVLIIVLGAFYSNAVGVVIIIVGSLSTLTTFALSLHKFYDSWKRYRDSVEKIKSLTRLYISENEPFNSTTKGDNEKLYILELDKLVLNEASEWKFMRDRSATNPSK